ncbi:MAG: hypothetical protein R3D30_14275 [Hyphomicrobiales bacterium]
MRFSSLLRLKTLPLSLIGAGLLAFMLAMPASAEPATGHAVQPGQSATETPADDAAAEIDIDPLPDADTAATEAQS